MAVRLRLSAPRARPHLGGEGGAGGSRRPSSPRVTGGQLWGWAFGGRPTVPCSRPTQPVFLSPVFIPLPHQKVPWRHPFQKLKPLTEAAGHTTEGEPGSESHPLPSPLPSSLPSVFSCFPALLPPPPLSSCLFTLPPPTYAPATTAAFTASPSPRNRSQMKPFPINV